MQIETFQHLGRREEQQDAYFISSDNKLFFFCVGAGGMENGALASNLAIKTISEAYSRQSGILDLADFKSMIYESIYKINSLLDKNVATTLVCLYIDNEYALYCHLGDSKLFYFNEKNNSWIATKDHSIVQELFDAGIIKTEEEILNHPLRNRITKAITPGIMPAPDDLEVEKIKNLNPGSIFVLCSDGVLEKTTNSAFAGVFNQQTSDLNEKVEIIRHQCVQKSADNCTLIAIEI